MRAVGGAADPPALQGAPAKPPPTPRPLSPLLLVLLAAIHVAMLLLLPLLLHGRHEPCQTAARRLWMPLRLVLKWAQLPRAITQALAAVCMLGAGAGAAAMLLHARDIPPHL